jgi:hypothetical protein
MKNENVNSDKCLNQKHIIKTNRKIHMNANQHLHSNEILNEIEDIVELNGNKYTNQHEHLIMVRFSLQSVIIESILNRRLTYQ